MKKQILFFIFLLFISNASAITLSISPPQINFDNYHLCQNISIYSNGNYNLSGKLLWAKEDYTKRTLLAHKYTSEEENIKINFSKKINLEKNKTIQICMRPKVGIHHGILLYRIQNKPIQVGIWINSNFEKKKFLILTGNSVKKNEIKNPIVFITAILLILFLILIIFLKKNKTS